MPAARLPHPDAGSLPLTSTTFHHRFHTMGDSVMSIFASGPCAKERRENTENNTTKWGSTPHKKTAVHTETGSQAFTAGHFFNHPGSGSSSPGHPPAGDRLQQEPWQPGSCKHSTCAVTDVDRLQTSAAIDRVQRKAGCVRSHSCRKPRKRTPCCWTEVGSWVAS